LKMLGTVGESYDSLSMHSSVFLAEEPV
jgi:hypothetical protein